MDSEAPITIAIDAMGGYGAPKDVVSAVGRLSRETKDAGVYYALVGDEQKINDLLLHTSHNPERISVIHAPTAASMEEDARSAHERKPDSSINTACRLVESGEGDAVVSAGHPGAAALAAFEHFDMIENADRAALASVYPTARRREDREGGRDRLSLMLDVGATMRADAEDLLSFALMGTAYSRIVSGVEEPRVALLSNSRESRSGPPEIVRANELFREHPGINFYGNVEGHEIPGGAYDVIVCEGFVGDIVLKILEGVGEAAVQLARSAYERRFAWRMGLRLLSGGLQKIKQVVDFEEYGGAPLLGIDGVMILAHPRSGEKAMRNAVKLAVKNVRADLPSAIAEALRP